MEKKKNISVPKLPNLEDKEMNMEEWISYSDQEKKKEVPEIGKMHKHVHQRQTPVAVKKKRK